MYASVTIMSVSWARTLVLVVSFDDPECEETRKNPNGSTVVAHSALVLARRCGVYLW